MTRNVYLRSGVACAIGWFPFTPAWANEISLEQAKAAVVNWTREAPHPLGAKLGQTVRSARTFSDKSGNALFHVVRFREGGYAVAAADDGILPIIAFSDDDDLVADERNPLWVMLNRDLPQRLAMAKKAARHQLPAEASDEVGRHSARWQQLLSASAANDYTTLKLSSVSDLRVSPLLTTTWNQWTDNNTSGGRACYNYYTPPYAEGASSNYVCGCVATAGAQLMRYHNYPTSSVAAGTYTIYVNGTLTYAAMKGGVYAWSDMPDNPAASSTTLAQRQAVGRLTYDVGVACHMQYTSTSSGAYDSDLVKALKDPFGYASAFLIENQTSGVDAFLQAAALSNLDAQHPVIFGISGSAGGHEVVGDGYGYSGATLYVHLNMGWGGYDNAWYNLPTVDAYYSFTVLDSIMFNVFPTTTGEIISGRVLDRSGAPVSGATVVATNQTTQAGVSGVVSDVHGVYALFVPEPTSKQTVAYQITASLNSRVASGTTTVAASATMTFRSQGSAGNSWGNNLTLPDPAPDAPTGVSASDGTSTASVAVSWSATTYATGYSVFRFTSDNSASASRVGGASGTVFSDVTATPGTLYYYWIKATNTTGSSAFSASESGYRALSAPTNVVASEASASAVTVTWGSVTGATHYRVYRAVSASDTKTALGGWQEDLVYSDATAVPGTTYYYWVAAAVDAVGTRVGAFSDFDTGLRLLPYTTTTEIPVPFSWLDAYGLVSAGDYEAAGHADVDGDGYAAWQEYVAGTTPTNASSVFTASIALSNGLPFITWVPDLGTARVYTVEGKSALTNAAWLSPTNSATRFFRVKVDIE